MAINNLDEADFTRDISRPKGAGEAWSARTASLLDAPIGYRFTDELDVVVQGISRYHDRRDRRDFLRTGGTVGW